MKAENASAPPERRETICFLVRVRAAHSRAAHVKRAWRASPPSSTQVTSVVKQQKERAYRGFPKGSRPAPKSLPIFLEIWEREAAPAELNLNLATILLRAALIPALDAFES